MPEVPEVVVQGLGVIASVGLLASVWSFIQVILDRRAATRIGANGEVEEYLRATTVSQTLKLMNLLFLVVALLISIFAPRPMSATLRIVLLASLVAMTALLGINAVHDVVSDRRAAIRYKAGKTIEEALDAVGTQVQEVHVLVNDKMDKALDRIEQLTQALIAAGGIVPPTPVGTSEHGSGSSPPSEPASPA